MVDGRQLSVVPLLAIQQTHLWKEEKSLLSNHTGKGKVARLVIGQDHGEDTNQIHILSLTAIRQLGLRLGNVGLRARTPITGRIEISAELITKESVSSFGRNPIDIGPYHQLNQLGEVETCPKRCGGHVV